MKHGLRTRMAGVYTEAFSWHDTIDAFVRQVVTERPILHVCSGPKSDFGDHRVDAYVKPIPPSTIADWLSLPFAANSFGSVFADPPWNLGYMKACADFCQEALRVAPVFYLMAPWLWCRKGIKRDCIWVREFPGVNHPILLVRYSRAVESRVPVPFEVGV